MVDHTRKIMIQEAVFMDAGPLADARDVADPGHDVDGLLSALRATGMERRDAMFHAMSVMGGDAVKPEWDAITGRVRSVKTMLGLLAEVAAHDPAAANAWFQDALMTKPIREWEDKMAYRGLPSDHQPMGVFLHGIPWLTSLPSGLKTSGVLHLRNCRHLTELPEGLEVGQDFRVTDCTFLRRLPDRMDVGDLEAKRCTSLTTLPSTDAFRVREGIDLDGCTSLTSLPEGLQVHGRFSVAGCTALERLPGGLRVEGNLWIYGCTSLTTLPMDMDVQQDIYAQGCTGLTHLPDGFHAEGGLCIPGCTSLKALPRGMVIGGDLDLWGCTALEAIPDDLIVKGNLALDGDAQLPPGFHTVGSIFLGSDFHLETLPDGLKVDGNFRIDAQRGPTSLPQGLNVGGNLELGQWTSWDGVIPDDAQVGGCIVTQDHPRGVTLKRWRADAAKGLHLPRTAGEGG